MTDCKLVSVDIEDTFRSAIVVPKFAAVGALDCIDDSADIFVDAAFAFIDVPSGEIVMTPVGVEAIDVIPSLVVVREMDDVSARVEVGATDDVRAMVEVGAADDVPAMVEV